VPGRGEQTRDMFQAMRDADHTSVEIHEIADRTHRTMRTNLANDADEGFELMVSFIRAHGATAAFGSEPSGQDAPIDSAAPYHEPIVLMRDHLDPDTGDVLVGGKIWIMESDGSRLRQLTSGDSYDDHPSLDRDGRYLLYSPFPVNNRLEYRRVYRDGRPYWVRKDGRGGVMDSDRLPVERSATVPVVRRDIATGEEEVVVRMEGCQLHHANLSPVDQTIAFQADCSDGSSRRLIGLLEQGGFVVPPPATNGVGTGAGAVFQREPNRLLRPRAVAIVRMDRGAGEPAFLTLAEGPFNHRRPTVSPDGRSVAWQSNAAGDEDDIFLAGFDGAGLRNLTDGPGNDGHPWFSRDGKWLVFESDRTGNWEIWRIDLETLAQKQLTFSGAAYSNTRARPR